MSDSSLRNFWQVATKASSPKKSPLLRFWAVWPLETFSKVSALVYLGTIESTCGEFVPNFSAHSPQIDEKHGGADRSPFDDPVASVECLDFHLVDAFVHCLVLEVLEKLERPPIGFEKRVVAEGASQHGAR